MTSATLYEQYVTKMQQLADVRNALAVLQWDQETYLPAKGARLRGQQISTLSELSHGLFISQELGDLLEELSVRPDLSEGQKRNVERTREDYLKNKKYTSAFVRALSDQTNKAFHAWIEARRLNSFGAYEKDLEALIRLKKEEAAILGYTGHPYNALLNEYVRGATVDLIDRTFAGILPVLKELSDRIAGKPQVDDRFLRQVYPASQQIDWSHYLLKELHYDLEAGRQDLSEHPFSISFNPGDVRITTRVDENDFGNMTWSSIHEVGHALYEQGLPPAEYGLPLGEACSYSIHESQSRLWENNVGRSRGFWQHHYPELQRRFPGQLGGVSLDAFYRGINRVEPSLIRTEADEITYHFHVFIRYELEKKLIDGRLPASGIPAFWNERYHELLGVKVPDDRQGCLQDVHWSHGSFGYFPTYSLGSFYAAQFFEQACMAHPEGPAAMERGDTVWLLGWLRREIHSRGRFYTSEELCEAVTGKTLDVGVFTNQLLQKYVSIYTL